MPLPPRRMALACVLAIFLPNVLHAQARPSLARQRLSQISIPTASGSVRQRAESFLLPRVTNGQSPAALRLQGMRQRLAMPHLLSSNRPWQPLGPSQIETTQFGAVTGRVTSIAIAPWDAAGNTVYLGSTGGGVWRSTNAAANDPDAVTWQPLTDNPVAFSGVNITSLSIGAVSVQPGTANVNGVVLAGTGDPNDVLDSYYGAGILRSADGGTTWRLITGSKDGFAGGITNYSFVGDAFSGFAWSTTKTNLVVAAVTVSYDSFVNNINNNGTNNIAEAGLYYSTDAGQTWFLSTIEDGPNHVIQSSQTTLPNVFPGVPVSAVVWNPYRKMFYAAVQHHGYYQSPDGVIWTRLTNQPGAALTSEHCPANPGHIGSNSCPIFRGVLAVEPATGDMFALTVDANNVDQGLWRDVCNAGATGCANPVQFGVKIPDMPLDSTDGDGTIPQGTYNLTLAAVPNGTDTLLFAGTRDIFRCDLAAGCVWRNTTNTETCVSARVAPAEHAIAAVTPAGQTLPLLYFGNDSGLWRSTDGVNQTGPACAPDDAAHYQNLNRGLGSLAEVTGLANSASDANVLLAGFGVNGSAKTADMGQSAWPQLLNGEGGLTAIDPANSDAWYATLAPYVSIGRCTRGTDCTAADFGPQSAIGATETDGDESLLFTPYILDPSDSTNLIVGTCRVWRGPADGSGWSTANAISPMLDGHAQPQCNGNSLIRSLAAGGTNPQPGAGPENNGAQIIYAGMAGMLDGGGFTVAGHVFSTQTANTADATANWMDLALSPVSNEQIYNGVFNPYRYDVSALYVDPHDPTGKTVYATIQGFGVPHLYFSQNGGANWINVTKNLPDLPLNDVLVDPNDAGVVYVASDGGVFVTQNISNCMSSGGQCWNILGTGLPLAPAVKLTATLADGGYLRVGTYGRGIWQTPLLSGVPQTTMTLAPTSLTFGGQAVQSAGTPQTVTITNTGGNDLVVSRVTVTGDFIETDPCSGSSGPIAPGNTCQIQVVFTPSMTGPGTGTLTVSANVPDGQQSVALSGTGTTQSAIVLLPNSVDFGEQQVDTTSDTHQVTVSNTSNNSIALTSESLSGPFAIQINTCSATLPPNTGCTLAIVFQPIQSGAATGTLTLISDEGTQTLGLTGTGESAPTDTLAPLSLSFPSTLENTSSAPQAVTLTNSGGTALTGIQVQSTGDFTVANGCEYTLNAHSSCTLTVRYTPHATGMETGSITVTDSLRNQTIQLSGTGIAPPTDTLSTASLEFPATVIGQAAQSQIVTLTNSGDSTLAQLSIIVIGSGFSATDTCGSALSAHTSCRITVMFHPSSAGNATGQIDVGDAIRTQIVSLRGTGQTPAQDNLSPLALTFSAQAVGTTSAAQTVVLSNNGQMPLTDIRVQPGNSVFPFTTDCGGTLQAGETCGIHVTFSPQTTGPGTGTLTVIDATRTQTVPLSGTGVLANITLAPANLDFGDVGVRISSPVQKLLLTNGSSGTLSGISIETSTPFAKTDNCAPVLAPGGSCAISLRFIPDITGVQNGILTVNSNDASPTTAHLTGIGIAYDFLPTSATTVSVTSGQAASYSLEVVPVNGSAGNVSLSCASLPPNSTCTVNPASASLSSASNVQVAIATGVGSGAGNSAVRIRRGGIGGTLPWPFGLLPVLLSLGMVRRGSRGVRSALGHFLMIWIVGAMLTGLTACGTGGGLLGKGSNPLPTNSLTPSGVYTVVVTAAAGGLQKSVSLTLHVQ